MRKVFILLIIILLFFTCDFFDEKESIDMGTIDIQPTPTPGAPTTTADYNNQNGIIQATINDMVSNPLLITEFGTLAIPQIADGVNIPHGGARYLVNGNTSISLSPSDGRVYIKLEVSGDQLLPSFVNSAVGFTWNYIYNGFYDGSGNQLLPYVIWKDGTNYYKFTLDFSTNRFNIESLIHVPYQVDIINWNMYVSGGGDFAKNVPHGLGNLYKKIRNLSAIIRNDTNTFQYNINYGDGTTGVMNAWVVAAFNTTSILLNVLTGGDFDNTDFDSLGGYLRGWVNFSLVL